MEDDKRATVSDGGPSFDHDREETLIGADVGGYVVEGELGRGGMGVVYAATHPMIGKRVAIKVIKHSLSNNPATVERFVQEARSVNQIGHPNIVDIFAFGALPDGRSYLIMDLLVGESLRKRVKRGPLSTEEAVRVLDEISGALAAAHDKGFIHRDLKPDNVYLHTQGDKSDVKLLDFGLAKLLPNAMSTRAFRTATGAMLGTPDYMSPEQLKGSGVDHRTDIYALGVLAFEILAGDRPRRYSDGSFELDGLSVPRHLTEVHGVPPALAELVDAMLSPGVELRPSLVEVRTVLKRVKNGQTEAVRAIGTAPSLGTFEASTTPLGRKLVSTPLTGSSTVVDGPLPQHSQPPAYSQPPDQPYSQPPPYSLNYSQSPVSQPPVSQPPAAAPQYGGLAKVVSAHPATRLGVAPAPARPSAPHPVAAARRGESRLWLYLGVGLVVGSGLALLFVLVT